MRVLICGSRDYENYDEIAEYISGLENAAGDRLVIIEGEARGADTFARQAAESMGIAVEKYPANWKKYGRAAGPIRNKQMLDEGRPNLVVAFSDKPLYNSKGTRNMVQQALKAGIKTVACIGGKFYTPTREEL